ELPAVGAQAGDRERHEDRLGFAGRAQAHLAIVLRQLGGVALAAQAQILLFLAELPQVAISVVALPGASRRDVSSPGAMTSFAIDREISPCDANPGVAGLEPGLAEVTIETAQR